MRKLSPRQKKFVENYLKTGNAKQSVIDAGYNVTTDLTARTQGSKLLKNEKVWALIESSAEMAQSNMVKLANTAKNEGVRFNANKDLLDRAGFQPVSKTQSTTINVNIDNQRFEDILEAYSKRKEE